MITASRRTPPPWPMRWTRLAREHNGFFWDGAGDNPYVPLLALATLRGDGGFRQHGRRGGGDRNASLLFERRAAAIRSFDAFIAGLKAQGAVQASTAALKGAGTSP